MQLHPDRFRARIKKNFRVANPERYSWRDFAEEQCTIGGGQMLVNELIHLHVLMVVAVFAITGVGLAVAALIVLLATPLVAAGFRIRRKSRGTSPPQQSAQQ
jgi:hypothetical protein